MERLGKVFATSERQRLVGRVVDETLLHKTVKEKQQDNGNWAAQKSRSPQHHNTHHRAAEGTEAGRTQASCWLGVGTKTSWWAVQPSPTVITHWTATPGSTGFL